ncbi:MAG: HDOD domain-containing protein [Rhodoferax sp.]|nr:HDOD domain-containing protein [Rhodoferax sp.]
MNLSVLLEQPFAVPSIPKVVALLLNALQQAEIDLNHITRLISTDVALTVRLLQLANSDDFGQQGQICTVSEALALLDLVQVLQMAHAAAASASLQAVPGMQLPQFWAYSLNVARIARSLANHLRLNAQAAYTVGLIHAIGELHLHAVLPDACVRLDAKVSPLGLQRAQAECKLLGYGYAHIGAGIARRAQFPAMMVDAIEHQFAPFDNQVYEPLAGIIHLAAWRARGWEAKLSMDRLAVSYPDSVGLALGLNIEAVIQQDPLTWASST